MRNGMIPHRVHHLVEVAVAHLPDGCPVVLVSFNFLGADVVGVLCGEVQEEVLGGIQVRMNGPRSVPGDLQFALHGRQGFLLLGVQGCWRGLGLLRWSFHRRTGLGRRLVEQRGAVHPSESLEGLEDGPQMLGRVGRVPVLFGLAPLGSGLFRGGYQPCVLRERDCNAALGSMH